MYVCTVTYDDIFSEFFLFVYIYVLGSQLVLAHMYSALCLHAVLYYYSIQHHVVVSFMIFVDHCSSFRSASRIQPTRALSCLAEPNSRVRVWLCTSRWAGDDTKCAHARVLIMSWCVTAPHYINPLLFQYWARGVLSRRDGCLLPGLHRLSPPTCQRRCDTTWQRQFRPGSMTSKVVHSYSRVHVHSQSPTQLPFSIDSRNYVTLLSMLSETFYKREPLRG